MTEKVREYNSITQCFDEFEYVESWDGAVRHPGNEDMFWYDMELFAEDDEEGSCWDSHDHARPEYLVCYTRLDLSCPDGVEDILDFLDDNFGNAQGDNPSEYAEESAKEELQAAIDKFCKGINFKVYEETRKRIRLKPNDEESTDGDI